MKIKNVNIFVRHVEKAVLGLAILLALAIYWVYIHGDPYAVPLGKNRTITAPSDVPKQVGAEAKKLEGKVNNPNSQLTTIPVPPFAQVYQRQLRMSLSGSVLSYDVPFGQHWLDPDLVGKLTKEIIDYSLPKSSPAPVAVRARVDPQVLKDLPDGEEMAKSISVFYPNPCIPRNDSRRYKLYLKAIVQNLPTPGF